MTKPSQIADRLGRRAIADAVGVGLTAVSNAVVRGSFPPGWYIHIKNLCDQEGIECPVCAFKWSSPEQRPSRRAS